MLIISKANTPLDSTGKMVVVWVSPTGHVSTELKRAARSGDTHQKAERFLFARRGRTPRKKQIQFGAARREHRCGSWMLAARRNAYLSKGQAFLPGRTGLTPLLRYLRRPGGWEKRVLPSLLQRGLGGFKGIVKMVTERKLMRVLVACEFGGIVRDAFIEAGHDAISCDLLPSERVGPHIQGDIRDVDLSQYDLMIAHPPCTYLAVSGARWFKSKTLEQAKALAFVRWLLSASTPLIALENPVSVISTQIRKPDQIIQPWQFGHGETKATCLWLKNLPLLKPTNIVEGREGRVWKMGPSQSRWADRSRTYTGIAAAMAEQWG